MKLIGAPLSPFVRKVAVVLTIKELAYEQEPLLPGSDEPEFRAVSPLGKIPALLDGEFGLADSSVICEYLEEKYPEIRVMPGEVEQRARSRFLEEYGDSKLVETTAVVFIENFVNPNIFGKEADTGRVAQAKNELIPPHLDYLESRVPQEGFLFETLGTADISIVSPLFTAAYGGYELDASRWPRYAAFFERVAGHPAVVKVRELEKQFVAQMQGGG